MQQIFKGSKPPRLWNNRPVRLLFAIAHFFDPKGVGGLGSTMSSPEERSDALTTTIASLLWQFSPRQYVIDRPQRLALQANGTGENVVDIVVCTTGDKHILER